MIDRVELLANTTIVTRKNGSKYATSRALFQGFAEAPLEDLSPSEEDIVLEQCRKRAADKVLDDVYGEIIVQLTAMKVYNNAVTQPELNQALTELINKLAIRD